MPNLTEQLKRDGNLLTRSQPKGKAPRRRIPAMSKKRQREAREYSKKRKAFLEARPLCEATWVIWPNRPTRPASTEVHHVKRRGKFYLDESSWLAVGREAHVWLHSHPKEARRLCLLA